MAGIVDDAQISGDLARVLFTEDQIAERMAEVAAQIDADYEGKDLLLVGVLNGAVMVIRPNGKGLRAIVRPPGLADSNPAWSPDGRHLLFVVAHELEDGLRGSELWVVSLNGRAVRRIEIPELPRDVPAEINGVDWTR